MSGDVRPLFLRPIPDIAGGVTRVTQCARCARAATGSKGSSTDHVEYTTGCIGNDVLSVFELLDVLADTGTTNTGVALDVHVVAERDDDLAPLPDAVGPMRSDSWFRRR